MEAWARATALIGCTPQQVQDYIRRSFPDRTYKEGDWKFDRLGDTFFYKVYYVGTANRSITLAGIDTYVTVQFRVPFIHRFVKMSFYNTDVLYAPSAIDFSVSVARAALINYPQVCAETLMAETRTMVSLIKLMDESEVYEGSSYTLTFRGTDLVFATFIIAWLGAG